MSSPPPYEQEPKSEHTSDSEEGVFKDEEQDEKVDSIYNKGDATIISSDGISFKVHKYHLLSASTVLADMHTYNDSEPIILELSHPNLEHSRIIRCFLHIITGDVRPIFKRGTCDLLNYLALLSIKWDAPLVTSTIAAVISGQYLTSLFEMGFTPSSLFILGGRLGDWHVCERAIMLNMDMYGGVRRRQWDRVQEIDVTRWTEEEWEDVPPLFVRMLLIAQRRHLADQALAFRSYFEELERA